jgi:hypothetical protein
LQQSPRWPPRLFVRYRAVFSSEAGKFVALSASRISLARVRQ